MTSLRAYHLSYILDGREGRRPAALVKKMRLAANGRHRPYRQVTTHVGHRLAQNVVSGADVQRAQCRHQRAHSKRYRRHWRMSEAYGLRGIAASVRQDAPGKSRVMSYLMSSMQTIGVSGTTRVRICLADDSAARGTTTRLTI